MDKGDFSLPQWPGRGRLSAVLPEIRNLHPAPAAAGEETLETILQGGRFRLEHIVSRGAASPEGFWYEQALPEWVALLTGTASLEFEEGTLDLHAGDCLVIPAGMRHRVSTVSVDAAWLAFHYEE